jgi:hypothetical protein
MSLIGILYKFPRGRATVNSLLFIINAPEINVFEAYIVVSGPKKSLIGNGSLPDLIPFFPPMTSLPLAR